MRPIALITAVCIVGITFLALYSIGPMNYIADWRAVYRTTLKQRIETYEYEVYDFSGEQEPFITVDFLKGEHFWYPQIAIWLESTTGEYFSTLLVTKSTAKGLFYSGRTADNFRSFDSEKSDNGNEIRRVNALPHWAFKRNIKAKDGLVVPHPDEPLPDGISGATPSNNFHFYSSKPVKMPLESFVIKLEVNVAFDPNKFYSEYDYLDDDSFHSGTGLLGQPSLIYKAQVKKETTNSYYLMQLTGHGHHSGKNGEVFKDLSRITTAKKIVDRVLVKINWQDASF